MCHLSRSLAFAICLFLSLPPTPPLPPSSSSMWKLRGGGWGGTEGAGFDCYIIPSFWPVQKIAPTEVAAKVSLSPDTLSL